jgi:hypothetical protein
VVQPRGWSLLQYVPPSRERPGRSGGYAEAPRGLGLGGSGSGGRGGFGFPAPDNVDLVVGVDALVGDGLADVDEVDLRGESAGGWRRCAGGRGTDLDLVLAPAQGAREVSEAEALQAG